MNVPAGIAAESAILVSRDSFSRAEDRALPALVEAQATPMSILAVAVKNGMDPATLRELMGLQERYEANQARKAFNEAMAAAKAEIPVVFKNKEVDFTSQKGRTHYKYEDLAEVARTVDPILAKHGLSYRFRTNAPKDGLIEVTCIIAHRSGHTEENTIPAPRDESGNKNAIQAIGSTLTYLQRMTLKASLGLSASTDDDGRGAVKTQKVEPDPEGQKALEACGSMASLAEAWKALTAAQRATLAEVKNRMKQSIEDADKEAAKQ